MERSGVSRIHNTKSNESLFSYGFESLAPPSRPTDGLAINIKDLPAYRVKREFLSALESNNSVIVTGPTGSGKTTQIPAFCAEEGLRVVVTLPTRVGALGAAQFVSAQFDDEVGGIVGFECSGKSIRSERTRIIYSTDGLELMHEWFSSSFKPDVLISDEIHVWNLNQEALNAEMKYQIRAGLSRTKFVLMSATGDMDSLSKYHGGSPVIKVPGRTYPITDLPRGESPIEDIIFSLSLGNKGVLNFPAGGGKREIDLRVRELKSAFADRRIVCDVFPIHNNLPFWEIRRCIERHEQGPVVFVASNLAAHSITPWVDAVVDEGIGKRTEVRNGIEGLFLYNISLEEREQRRGRVGRFGPGFYVDWCPIPRGERNESSDPEIRLVHPHQHYLRGFKAGLDLREKRPYHPIPDNIYHRTIEELENFKCVVTSEGNALRLTDFGHRAAMKPLTIRSCKILEHAHKLDSQYHGLLGEMLLGVSVIENHGLIRPETDSWKQFVGNEHDSDVIAEIGLFKAGEKIETKIRSSCHFSKSEEDIERDLFESLSEIGVNFRTFKDIQAMRNKLSSLYKTNSDDCFDLSNPIHKRKFLECIVIGFFDRLYSCKMPPGQKRLRANDKKVIWEKDGDQRTLSRSSVIDEARYIVAYPFEIEVLEGAGSQEKNLLFKATKIDEDLLKFLRCSTPFNLSSRKLRNPKLHSSNLKKIRLSRFPFGHRRNGCNGTHHNGS